MDKEMKVIYSSLPRAEINNETADGNIKMEEKSPLLENMESLIFSSPMKFDPDSEKDNESLVRSVKENDDTSRRQTNMTPKTDADDLGNDEANITPTQHNKTECVNVNKSTEHVIHVGKPLEKNNEKTNSADDTIDIVRKMSEATSEGYIPWQKIGFYRSLKLHRCQRVYAKSKRADDLVLLFNNGKFFIMEAWCSHMGEFDLFHFCFQFQHFDYYNLACHSRSLVIIYSRIIKTVVTHFLNTE